MSKKQRVIVGMSGGVDSSVTAAMLLEQDYDVIGMTMQLLPKEEEKVSMCCNLGAINDAKRVCQKLGIPHYTINSRDNFQKRVIDPFINQYAIGQTPNPCVECNRYIKFDELWAQAATLDADFIATGHYSQIIYDEATDRYSLKMAQDPSKDQSYFLYMMTQDQLKRTLFPLGGFLKTEIRAKAEALSMVNANKPDSQEICFVSSKSYKDFVKKHIPDPMRVPGTIQDTEGTILAGHEGIYGFTIGQRKGLNVSAAHPLYVLSIDPKTNVVTVGPKGALQSSNISCHTFTLINPDEAIAGTQFEIKSRYQMKPFTGTLVDHNPEEGTVTIEALTPQETNAPGQSCVLYQGGRLVGGGIISPTRS
ncbi:tRNA 2-thiouridine(34) synthase MnmA [bacterium]|nr:tRNA 2-thiouridine(34) synthase MnmA [bacterium]